MPKFLSPVCGWRLVKELRKWLVWRRLPRLMVLWVAAMLVVGRRGSFVTVPARAVARARFPA